MKYFIKQTCDEIKEFLLSKMKLTATLQLIRLEFFQRRSFTLK